MSTERPFIGRIRPIGRICRIIMTLPLVAALHGAAFAAEPREERTALEARVASLMAEQDLLLFRKLMLAADSKYLLLDLAARRGELRYRNRLLKEFRVTVKRQAGGPRPTGALTLTERRTADNGGRLLVFGDALVIGDRRSPASAGAPVRAVLSREDLTSLFTVLDTGSRAYVVR